jgi:hypothetical protein
MAKTKAATNDTAGQTFEPRDFVYMGMRWLPSTKEAAIALAPLCPETGKPLNTRMFDVKRGRSMIVGGIYRGAEFSQSMVRGLDRVNYSGGRYGNTDGTVSEWEALDSEARVKLRSQQMERKDKGANEIMQRSLQELHERFTAALTRGDMATCEALKAAVVRALCYGKV